MFYPSLIGSGFGSTSYALTTATQAESAAREARNTADALQHDIDRLLLITEALWTIVKQDHGYADDTLVGLIQDIEARRTAAGSNSIKDSPVACPACGRTNTAARPFCMYCGKPLPMNPFAR